MSSIGLLQEKQTTNPPSEFFLRRHEKIGVGFWPFRVRDSPREAVSTEPNMEGLVMTTHKARRLISALVLPLLMLAVGCDSGNGMVDSEVPEATPEAFTINSSQVAVSPTTSENVRGFYFNKKGNNGFGIQRKIW